MGAEEAQAAAWVDGVLDEMYDMLVSGLGQRLRVLFGWSSTYNG